jgi:hypothetical protein
MRAFILAAMLGVAASAGAECAYAEDQDSVVRPRPGSDYQSQVLRAPRVVVYSTDMKGVPAGGSTTDFGAKGFIDLTESTGNDNTVQQ